MSVTALKPRLAYIRKSSRFLGAEVGVRTAREFREHAKRLRCSTEDLVLMVLTDYALKLRRERNQKTQRSAILSALEQAGCTFRGSVEPRHRTLARQLEKIDAKVSA